MLTQYDIYLFAASRGWTATIDLLHPREYIQGVFLSRSARTTLLGPLGALQQMTVEQFFDLLEQLDTDRAAREDQQE